MIIFLDQVKVTSQRTTYHLQPTSFTRVPEMLLGVIFASGVGEKKLRAQHS